MKSMALVLGVAVVSATLAGVRADEPKLPEATVSKVVTWPLTGEGDWKPPEGKAYVHLRCIVTTKKGRVTLGNPEEKPKDADIVGFSDFALVLPDKKTVTASALGEMISNSKSPTFRKAPSGYVTLSNFNDKASYEWEVHLVFLIPAKTDEVKFQFGKQDAETVKLPDKK